MLVCMAKVGTASLDAGSSPDAAQLASVKAAQDELSHAINEFNLIVDCFQIVLAS